VASDPDNELSTLRIPRVATLAPGDSEGDAAAHLIVLAGHAPGRRHRLDERLELGRGESTGIEIFDEGVSRRHARIERDAEGIYRIFDLGSRNGTWVNGKRIDVEVLRYGDKISLGSKTVLLFAHRDRFEDQRIQAQKLQALGQLAGGIAHDFNNLLGVVIANLSYLQGLDTIDEGLLRETMTEMETAARRAVDLTHQLLGFARSSQRHNHATDVAHLVDDATRLLRRTLHRSIEVRTHAVEGMVVVGDSSQLLQVLMNLCINAGDAMPHGGVLEIRAAPKAVEGPADSLLPAGEYVVISVRDDGVGMTSEIRDRVFEPFFTTKPRGKGTGLGLATAYAIVRDHGGQIRVESQPGKGATFEVSLPRAAFEQASHQRLTEDRVVPVRGVVLLADDEPLVRRAARRVLQHARLEVLEAADGEQAVELLREHGDRVDLVLLDLDMPRVSGDRALPRLRALHPGVKVLISSGYVDREREQSLRDAGVDGILHKPYDSRALVQAIARTLAGSADR
jgi:two-component system, cell cycle sensor histidine kinase and response regulator CckA